jgi:dienelactone hydrolase
VFEYFPTNYVWSMAVVAALNNGGLIDEVDRASRPVLKASRHGDDAGTEELYASWLAVAEQLVSSAEKDETENRTIAAGDKFYRASLYVSQAERLQSPMWAGRKEAYQKSMDLLLRSVRHRDPAFSRAEVPYKGTALPAYFIKADRPDGRPAPVIIQWNGLDSTKEMMYYSGFGHELARRGISTLMVDTPGSGEALRLRGLTAQYNTEEWASACVDYLETRDDVDANQIGIVGMSLGGYYAPRAAAFEKRLKLVVAWGANHNWGEVQHARRQREGENPVPHYWDHVKWVWGEPDTDKFLQTADQVNLNGVVEQITVPFLITHGIRDRQIPVRYAEQSYEQAVNSPKRELRIFTDEEGGTEHISIDHLPMAASYIADWISTTFADLPVASVQ